MKGDIILMENKSGSFFAKAIKFFTGRLAKKYGVPVYTHSCFSIGEIFGVESVLSAELAMCAMPLKKFRSEKFMFKVYRIKDRIKEKALDNILKARYEKSAGEGYAFLQNVWFIYRAIMEFIGFDMKGSKNWFPDHENCSESTADYMIERFESFPLPNSALFQLREFNTNSISPVDLAIIIKQNPHLFELAESWG